MPRKLTIDSLKPKLRGFKNFVREAEAYGDTVGELQYKERLEDIAHDFRVFATDFHQASIALFF